MNTDTLSTEMAALDFAQAEANDPALAGLSPNQTAWYAPSGNVAVVTITGISVVIDLYDVDGQRSGDRMALGASCPADVVATLIASVIAA